MASQRGIYISKREVEIQEGVKGLPSDQWPFPLPPGCTISRQRFKHPVTRQAFQVKHAHKDMFGTEPKSHTESFGGDGGDAAQSEQSAILGVWLWAWTKHVEFENPDSPDRVLSGPEIVKRLQDLRAGEA